MAALGLAPGQADAPRRDVPSMVLVLAAAVAAGAAAGVAWAAKAGPQQRPEFGAERVDTGQPAVEWGMENPQAPTAVPMAWVGIVPAAG